MGVRISFFVEKVETVQKTFQNVLRTDNIFSPKQWKIRWKIHEISKKYLLSTKFVKFLKDFPTFLEDFCKISIKFLQKNEKFV